MKSRGMILWLILALVLMGCSTSNTVFEGSYVSIHINPEIDLIFDSESHVTHVFFGNEEAHIIFSDIAFEGKTLSESLDLIIHESVNTGYIDLLTSFNAILVYAHKTDDETDTYQDEVIQLMERKLNHEGIGGLVLKQSDYDQELITIMSDYDVSMEKAVLMKAYAKATDESLDTVAKLSVARLYDKLPKASQDMEQSMTQEQRLSEKKALEDELITSVRDFRRGVLQGLIDSPDQSDFISLFEENPAQVLENISRRNQGIRPYVKAKRSGGLETYVIGQYVYEGSTYALTYRVVHHVLLVNNDGTFVETYLWSSNLHDASASNTSDWSITNGRLDVLNDAGFHMYYEIGAGRLIEKMLNGNVKTYVKVPSVNA